MAAPDVVAPAPAAVTRAAVGPNQNSCFSPAASSMDATIGGANTTPPSISAKTSYSSAGSPDSNPDLAASDHLSSSYNATSTRRFPTDLTSPIPEEGDEETESEPPNEPLTPTSGRQSRDFQNIELHQDLHNSSNSHSLSASLHSDAPISHIQSEPTKPPLLVQTSATPSPKARRDSQPTPKSLSAASTFPKQDTATETDSTTPIPLQRRSTRGSSSSLQRVKSLFRRSYSNVDKTAAMEFQEATYNGGSELTLSNSSKMTPNSSTRRFSFHRSVATTRSNTPPSPDSPLEMASVTKENATRPTVPTSSDFFENKKKDRASTGFSFRSRGTTAVKFTGDNKGHPKQQVRRTRSLERKKKKNDQDVDLTRQPWAIAPDAGTGMKARRLSLSLPDDFTVDVAELLKEFEYQSKLLGRHGRHLGKGATSKVTLMVRKGSPTELYAVKEFRGKNASETAEDYEKKIKSEYSIAKSLHHPNIVETIRLCTDHGRWNHVMEYCSEGDLFSLVAKKYLQAENREIDRLCLFKQLIQGINYLHSNGIAHRDIKLENLLITKDSKLKITDFGVSEVFCGIHPGLREAGGQCGQGMGETRLCEPGICGSLPYIAPEVLTKGAQYDPRALDVWSSAVVMIYLQFGGNLWEKADPKAGGWYEKLVAGWDKYNRKKEANPDLSKDEYPHFRPFDEMMNPPALRRLLLSMLNPDPKKRMTIQQVVDYRWMKGVECCQLESYEDPTKLIDASKKNSTKSSFGKIYCHNHLPPVSTGHGLPPMPGKAGY